MLTHVHLCVVRGEHHACATSRSQWLGQPPQPDSGLRQGYCGLNCSRACHRGRAESGLIEQRNGSECTLKGLRGVGASRASEHHDAASPSSRAKNIITSPSACSKFRSLSGHHRVIPGGSG